MTGRDLSVLVVDDDYRVAAVHVGFVERVEGFRVAGRAHTAADALALAESNQLDLVLLDVYLPDIDGIQLALALLERPNPPAVIVISAANDAETVRRAIQLGAMHYLVKPFSFATLEERLRTFRHAREHLESWPEEATQGDVDRMFDLLRPTPQPDAESTHLAPTLQLVYDAVAAGGASMSSSEIAAVVGISRATAQRYLARLEQTKSIKLELRYGSTGRPEHRYSVRH